MSNDHLSPSREHTSDPLLDRLQASKDEIITRVNLLPFLTGKFVTGLVQSDGSLSDGITFTAGQVIDVPHGLDRTPIGFVVVDARKSDPQLRRDDTRPSDEQLRLIRLTHAGGSTTVVKVLVF